MGYPGDDIIDRLRKRLCCRFIREVDEAGREFPDDGACIRWLVPHSGLCDRNWLKEFFPAAGPTLRDEESAQVQEPRGTVRGKTLRGWWQQLAPQILAWGRQQPWAQHGDGVEGLLGEAYVRAVTLWQHSNGSFALPPTQKPETVTEWTDCPLTWMTTILRRLAAERPRAREFTLTYDPECRPTEGTVGDGTLTHLPDRQEMTRRVEYLSHQLPNPVPNLPDRLGGRGTLQLLLVADQLETAFGLPAHYRLQWCLQTLAGKSTAEVAAEMITSTGNVEVRFCRIRDSAQSKLAALWCKYVETAPAPKGNTDE